MNFHTNNISNVPRLIITISSQSAVANHAYNCVTNNKLMILKVDREQGSKSSKERAMIGGTERYNRWPIEPQVFHLI